MKNNGSQINEPSDEETVTRRNFLRAISGTVAGASILVLQPQAASAQTPSLVTPASSNAIGTGCVNVTEFPLSGTDITDELNAAIASVAKADLAPSVPRGGQILIPRGRWTTKGGHILNGSISIEGAGTNLRENTTYPWGSELQLAPISRGVYSDFVFKLNTNDSPHNCAIKNISLLLDGSNSTGLLITNDKPAPSNIKLTTLENVTFSGGDFGIKVDSKPLNKVNFECIVNRFERLTFSGCKTAFYNSTVNCGYSFDNCFFMVPANGTAIHSEYTGSISVDHCLFLGVNASAKNNTVLRTTGVFNSISFYDCQDEGITYAYQNSTNPNPLGQLTYRNCVIQSKFKFTGQGSITLDSCRVWAEDPKVGAFQDTANASVAVYLKGYTSFFCWKPLKYYGVKVGTFVNPYSRVINEAGDVGTPFIATQSDPPQPAYALNGTSRGIVKVAKGSNQVVVNNVDVRDTSIVFALLQSQDPGGAHVSSVVCELGRFTINLDKPASANLRVAFRLEWEELWSKEQP